MLEDTLARVMAMGALWQLVGTCAAMFFGAIAAGLLPYFLRVTEQQLSLVSSLGAGVLIGSALAVILPEGFGAFSSAVTAAGTMTATGRLPVVVLAGAEQS